MTRENTKTGLPPAAPENCRVLILGTMPGERSLVAQQYYAHPSNQFRRLAFDAFEKPFSDSYPDFIQLLHREGIGLWNVIASCEREGSADKSITHPVPNDIKGFLEAHPSVEKILFESKKAAQLHDRFLERFPHISYSVLPSASAQFARMSYAQKLVLWKAHLPAG